MKTARRKVGDLGEDLAIRYLKSQKYKIIECNVLRKWGELDIVAKNNQGVTFVEVKTLNKKRDQTFFPEQNISYHKKRSLIRTAQLYLAQKNYPPDTSWQIDVIAVELNWQTHRANLRHLKNAVWN
ncbi:MAG: hypothetical protein COY09_00225 [Candidatus Portnoybacteria bacterium CG_4_10_14_0_2_um_filter_39_11]|uniref:UPF0102 protein COY09_00225 n=1 Tax=Candidatus Portnoybacteria bacterium CG_4_10_14_0_2_um_filter_39_11 TaxID=1974797 RepID=A0A2M7UKA3_9BACT|nr:MAG: hypothetical protein AUJ33_02460 [Parcubacteria group bacterium CG1_02_40_25]PIZ71681.1 MAG: hypothetical protein COY09_00225 [Candidatus Portnoybacteria bacterium CG_4_10_14_0_2_um_filter_39_11]